MTDLEFIEQFIKGTELTLNTYIQLQAEELSHPNIYDKSIEITKKELQHFQRIKGALEAWEVCKKHHYISKYDDESFDITIWLNHKNCGFKGCASMEDILKVKKELEIANVENQEIEVIENE